MNGIGQHTALEPLPEGKWAELCQGGQVVNLVLPGGVGGAGGGDLWEALAGAVPRHRGGRGAIPDTAGRIIQPVCL